MIVNSVTVIEPGDESVGLRTVYHHLEIYHDSDLYGDEEEAAQVLEHFRSKLKSAYEVLSEGPVYVMFDFEDIQTEED